MINILVNDINRNAEVAWRSLRVQQVITSQPDRCSFSVDFNGTTKTFEPVIGDEVVVEDTTAGVKIFGGIVVRVRKSVKARELVEIQVECVSFERDLDRFLVTDSYDNESAFYIINSLIHDYANRNRLVLYAGTGNETWVDETGSGSDDGVNRVYSEYGRKYTILAGNSIAARVAFSPAKDLDVYDNGNAGAVTDKLVGWVKVTGGITEVRVRLGSDTGGTYTNYLEESFTGLQQGWQQLVIDVADMSESGTFDRNSVDKIQFYAEATGGDGEVIFSDWMTIPEDGYTQHNVIQADTPIAYARFNYQQVSKAIQQVVEGINFDWYIDPDRDVHVFPQAAEDAPFDLTDDNANYIFDSLDIENNRDSLRNEIIVRGGEEIGNTQTEDLTYQVDGVNTIFQLGYKYADLAVDLNGTPQTIGIENIDEPTSVDVLYNFNEKTIKFTQVTPTPPDTVVISGKPYIPVIVKKRDAGSVAQYGTFQYLIVDKTINSREAARQRAQAELNTYRLTLQEGSFKSYQSGLHAGQTINIQSSIRNINEDFVISKLSMNMQTPNDPVYTASIVSTRTFGMIELLIMLLQRENKQITIGSDEVLDVVETYEETITITETISIGAINDFPETISIAEAIADYIDDMPTWVAGPYSPTSLLLDRKRPMFADRSNILAY